MDPEEGQPIPDISLCFAPVEFAAVQRTTAARQLTCGCTEATEVFDVSPEMSPSCLETHHSYSHITFAEPPEVLRRRISTTSRSYLNNIAVRKTVTKSEDSEDDEPSTSGTLHEQSRNNTLLPTPPELTQWRPNIRGVISPMPLSLAVKVADRVIKYARYIENKYEEDLFCPICGMLPNCPVTLPCGHTHCTKCIRYERICPCGNKPSHPLHENILIRDLVTRMRCNGLVRRWRNSEVTQDATEILAPAQASYGIFKKGDSAKPRIGPIRRRRWQRPATKLPYSKTKILVVPMATMVRFNYAVSLVESKRYLEAMPHLALAAASCIGDSNEQAFSSIHKLLSLVVKSISVNRKSTFFIKHINQSVRRISSTHNIFKPSDIECILCCDTFTEPVTTPCGHMFCRICIERTMDYNKRCPLCLRSLEDFRLSATEDTAFIRAALKMVNVINVMPQDDDLIPIFVCTVAYPSVPCPLFIFHPRYWLMVRRVLESETRRFAMVAYDKDHKYVDYGTLLEVRDCVHLEDGRCILSTVGLSRFKVISRSFRDGCEVAKIQPISDVKPVDDMEVWELQMLATEIMCKALQWLDSLDMNVLRDIESAFGTLPHPDPREDWWETSDGPSWLWWLIAILPLRTEIKVLILSTDCLLKRMLAVSRTLKAVNHDFLRTSDFRYTQSSGEQRVEES